ncbi:MULTISPECIES: hypothetical protein [unclassified Microcoleus]|uniref:hypothetical protein n=1 Tax=unclassified Microcoleus TaxID=2642155 RepID=UPI002FCFAE65
MTKTKLFSLKNPIYRPSDVSPGKILCNATRNVKCARSYVQRKGSLTIDSCHSVETGNTEATGCGGLAAVTPTKTNETAIKTPYKLTDSLRSPIPTHCGLTRPRQKAGIENIKVKTNKLDITAPPTPELYQSITSLFH